MRVVGQVFDPEHIDFDVLGNPDSLRMVKVGARDGWQSFEGDGGCVGRIIQTGVQDSTLRIHLGTCDGNVNPTRRLR